MINDIAVRICIRGNKPQIRWIQHASRHLSVICVYRRRVRTPRNTLFRAINLPESRVLDRSCVVHAAVLYSEHISFPRLSPISSIMNLDFIRSRGSATAIFVTRRLTFLRRRLQGPRGFSLFHAQGLFGRDSLNCEKSLPRLVCGFLPHPRMRTFLNLLYTGCTATPAAQNLFSHSSLRTQGANSEWLRDTRARNVATPDLTNWLIAESYFATEVRRGSESAVRNGAFKSGHTHSPRSHYMSIT